MVNRDDERAFKRWRGEAPLVPQLGHALGTGGAGVGRRGFHIAFGYGRASQWRDAGGRRVQSSSRRPRSPFPSRCTAPVGWPHRSPRCHGGRSGSPKPAFRFWLPTRLPSGRHSGPGWPNRSARSTPVIVVRNCGTCNHHIAEDRGGRGLFVLAAIVGRAPQALR